MTRPRRWFRCARCTVLRFEADRRDDEHDDCPWFPDYDPPYERARPADGIPVRFPPGWIDPPAGPLLSRDDPRWPRRSFLHWLMGVPDGWPWA